MNNQRMIFTIDRHIVTEGDVVEVSWRCIEAEQADLTLNNGYRSTTVQLPAEGTKRFRLNRSKGRTRLTIGVTIDGRHYSKTLRVRVKPMPVVHAETVDNQGRRQNPIKQAWQKILTKCHNIRQRLKDSMRALPESKQVAVKLLVILGLILLLSGIWPRVYSIGYLIIIAYLAYLLFRK